MTAIPQYRAHAGSVLLSAGFRPFFLASSIWAAVAIPLWLAVFAGEAEVPSALSSPVWHAHEMVFGFAAAAVAGFLLTAIPNWTGRIPLHGGPLACLVLLWAIGRIGVLLSGKIGAPLAALADLSFPAAFLGVVAREILAGKNWRNLPMLAALSLLLFSNLLVHLSALRIAGTDALGNRIGVATLLMLISLVGGRIIPSFTRNWLAKMHPEVAAPAAPGGRFDRAALAITAIALAVWAFAPETGITGWAVLAGGAALAARLARWRGWHTLSEPLLLILHIGYGWLALGLVLLGTNQLLGALPPTAALHALTVGAIGTMILAVMTRASLGHTGRPLIAGPGTNTIYIFITLAAVLRVIVPLTGGGMELVLSLAGASWSVAFGLFAILYGRALASPRVGGEQARPI